ncbi:MAG: BON domain-containing protein [Xanthomonadaceae bacterium]|nr:BON domain-containing protein [Xanthomonadaceae bacterium]
MKHSRHFSVIALVAGLGLALSTPAVLAAPQNAAPTGDHSSSASEAVSDAWITTKVKTDLATTKGIESTKVSVTTVDGVVTLTGVLPTELAVKKAIAVTRSIKGVKGVDASGLKSGD